MEELKNEGLASCIDVSKIRTAQLPEILNTMEFLPLAKQVAGAINLTQLP